MSSISRKAVYKRALYKSVTDSDNLEFAARVRRLTDFTLEDPGMAPALNAIVLSSRIYSISGTYQRFQCIDKMWVPLMYLARTAMRGQWQTTTDLGLKEIRTAAAMLHDFIAAKEGELEPKNDEVKP